MRENSLKGLVSLITVGLFFVFGCILAANDDVGKFPNKTTPPNDSQVELTLTIDNAINGEVQQAYKDSEFRYVASDTDSFCTATNKEFANYGNVENVGKFDDNDELISCNGFLRRAVRGGFRLLFRNSIRC